MNWWIVAGLILDLVGVLLLGFDLVSLQLKLRNQSQERVDQIDGLIDQFQSLAEPVKSAASHHHWMNHNYDEGQFTPSYEGVNVEAAQRVVDAAAQATEDMQNYAQQMASLISASSEFDQETAQVSVKVSYWGLGFILLGFSLQIFGTVLPVIKSTFFN